MILYINCKIIKNSQRFLLQRLDNMKGIWYNTKRRVREAARGKRVGAFLRYSAQILEEV